MMSRLTLMLVLFAMAVGAARAGTPFTPDAFAAAQATGKPVLVEVHADWCPVCTRLEGL
jgi:thiol:disulfide interchange protein